MKLFMQLSTFTQEKQVSESWNAIFLLYAEKAAKIIVSGESEKVSITGKI